jgi:5'-3' exonuclease
MHDLLLIDGDILVYRCAFSAESTSSFFVKDDKEVPIENIKEARKRQDNYDIVKKTTVAPEYVAIQNLESMIDRIKREVPHKECVLVLSSSKREVNKRTKIARQIPYKADRPPKPFHYAALRKHMEEVLMAVVVEEGEADDYLGAKQTGTSVIASIDKDLLQIPGDHFDINSNTLITASKLGQLDLNESNKLSGTGFKWFCAQCLLGDRTDAIQGIPYIRQTKVHSLLTGAKTEHETWTRVVKEYMDNKKVPLGYLKTEETEEQARMRYLKEMAQLVWISHSDDDYYVPNIDGVQII